MSGRRIRTLEEEAQKFYDSFVENVCRLLDQVESGDENACKSLESTVCDIDRKVRYYVTLASVAPAARLVVELDKDEEVLESVRFECQNQDTSWIEAPRKDDELVERYLEIVMSRYGSPTRRR